MKKGHSSIPRDDTAAGTKKNGNKTSWFTFLQQPGIGTLLAIISLIVSGVVAYKQLSFTEMQVKLAEMQIKAQHQPTIHISEDPFYSQDGLLERKIITIYNYGAELREPELRWGTYVRIAQSDNSDEAIELPITGYYSQQFPTKNLKEVIFRLEGGKNYDKLYRLTEEIRSKTQNSQMTPLSAITYIEVHCKDKLDQCHADYFKVGAGENSIKVTPEKALSKIEKVLALRSQGSPDILIFASLTSEQLLQKMKQPNTR